MNPQQVLASLLKRAQSATDAEVFDEDQVSVDEPYFYEQVVEAFGSWSIALGAALMHLLQEQESAKPAASSSQRAAVPVALTAPSTRKVTENAGKPLYLLSDFGHLNRLLLSDLEMTGAQRWTDLPGDQNRDAWPAFLHMGWDDDTFFALGSDGFGGSLHGLHFNDWYSDTRPSLFGSRILGGNAETPAVAMFPRRELRLAERLYAVTNDGQIKASDASLYAKKVGNEAIDVILPRDGACAIAMFSARQNAAIFMASSAGKAIVFDASDIRSQGLKAQGVRGLLLDDGAQCVSAFPIELDEIVLVTAQGFVKHMLLEEFRPQGRGGGGLQTCKLSGNDRVIAVLQTQPEDDLLLVSSEGAYLRMPVYQIPHMGRAARGEQLVAPTSGQQLVTACIVPAGSDSSSDA